MANLDSEQNGIGHVEGAVTSTTQERVIPRRKSLLRKIILRTALIIGIFFLLIIAASAILTLVFGDQVKQFAINEINKQLATEVKVNGPISFSVLSHFPNASVCFENVSIAETLPEKNNFVSCEKITLLFNLKDLWSRNYVINKVTAENGTVAIHVDAMGNRNYEIFKKSSSPSSNFSLKITDAELNNFVITYLDEKNSQDYSFKTDQTELQGNFSSSQFTLNIDADAFSNFLKSNGIDYLPQRSLKVKGAIDCDVDDNKYIFKNVLTSVNGNSFRVDGSVTSLDNGNDLQLKITGENLDLAQLISLLPNEYSGKFSSYKISGGIDFTGEISGVMSSASSPLMKADFKLSNAKIGNNDVKEIMSNINLTASYTNGTQHNKISSVLSVNKFSSTIEGNSVSGSFLLRNFSTPSADAMLDGTVDLATIYPLFKTEAVKALSGSVDFHNCFYRGELSALRSSSFDINKIQAGGKFDLKNLKVITPQATYENLNGSFEIQNNDISFSNCAFTTGSSDLRFDGTVTNFFPFLFTALGDSTVIRQKIGINAELVSNILHWEDLVGTGATQNSNDDYAIPSVFYRLSGAVSGSAKQFSYEKFHAEDLHGKILFLPGNIYFNDVGLKAENGTVTANGKLDISRSAKSRLDLTAKLDQLDLSQLFYEFNNFDQTTLTNHNLKGNATANISLQSVWDNNKLNLDALHAIADVTVENGELNNFQPMMALGTFIKVNELKNIRFSKMQNQIEIKNRKVLIPGMDIFSSALNVHLSGTHDFDNIIDYKVQLNLLRLLTDKFRKSNYDVSNTDQSTEGFLNLYLTMTGPASDPVIKYDKQAVKQKIATDLAEEKQNLKDVLKKEFNDQDASQEQAKDWKPSGNTLQYFDFQDDSAQTDADNTQKSKTATQENQKKAVDNFKSLFQKTPKN